eukprot:c16201_g1_i1 orf=43-993(+)
MAPQPAGNLQQLFLGACQQLKDHLSSAALAQPDPCDPQAHIFNFLQNLGTRQPSPSEDRRGFHLRFPFPFAGLFLKRERCSNLQVSDSETLTQRLGGSSNGDLQSTSKNIQASDSETLTQFLGASTNGDLRSRNKQVRVSKDGEEGLQTLNLVERGDTRIEEEHISVGDGTGSHGSHRRGSTELQILQMQLENSALAPAPASKEVLGRATWTLLHTLAAQFPEKPTRQQQRDAKELMAILSRLYPCKECADHFKEVLKANPVQAGSGAELAQWMCMVHNVVNRSLGKSIFPCQRVDARWGAMDCDEGACSLQGRTH